MKPCTQEDTGSSVTKPLIKKHGSRSPYYCHALPLNNPILLWVLRNCQLSLDAFPYTKIIEAIRGILTPIVSSQHLDLIPCLVLHKRLEHLELHENLILGLHEENLGLLGEVINKCDILLITTQ